MAEVVRSGGRFEDSIIGMSNGQAKRSVQAISTLKPGDHLLCLYQTEVERRAVLTPCLQQGLERGEKVLYIVDHAVDEDALAYLDAGLVEVSSYLASRQLEMVRTDEALCDGIFEPDSLIRLLRSAVERALREGYLGVRVAGEVTSTGALARSGRLIEYESRLNDFARRCRCLTLCQYDRRRFSSAMLLDVLETHPIASVGTKMYDNLYYTRTDEFVGQRRSDAILDRWLENLELLDQTEERVRKLSRAVEQSPCSIVITDTNGVIEYVNPKFTDLTGYAADEVIGQNPRILKSGDMPPEAYRELWETVLHGREWHGEFHNKKKNGQLYWERAHLSPIKNARGAITQLLAIKEDITDRVEIEGQLGEANERLLVQNEELRSQQDELQAQNEELQVQGEELIATNEALAVEQRALAESEERFRSVVQSSVDAIICSDSFGKIVFWNRAAEDVIGYAAGDVVGKPLTTIIPQRFRELHQQGMERVLSLGGSAIIGRTVEVVVLKKNGDEFPAELSLGTFSAADGGKFFTGILRDISARKQAEQFKEEYVSLISHDLRTPLTSLIGSADLLQRRLLQQGSEVEAHSAEVMLKSAKRMNGMVQDLVESTSLESGQVRLQKEPTDIAELVRGIVSRMGAVDDRQRIRVDALPATPLVAADRERLERAIVNLLTNALKYSPDGTEVVADVRRSGDQVTLSIADRGIGIPEEDLGHVFERYYRAKSAVKQDGLGLGLYITRLIVEAHGGRVSVVSEVGQGSRFCLSLPVVTS